MEGKTDQRVIPYLMEANGVPWPDHRDPDCPAFIAEYGSVNEILKPESRPFVEWFRSLFRV